MSILPASKTFRQQGALAGQATQPNSIRGAPTVVAVPAGRPQAGQRRGNGRMPTSMSNRGAAGAATWDGVTGAANPARTADPAGKPGQAGTATQEAAVARA